MPLLEIEIVGPPPAAEDPDIGRRRCRELADQAGALLGAGAQQTWVRLRWLPEAQYAESGGAPPGPSPVFVTLLLRTWPEERVRSQQAAELSALIGAILARPPERVHVLYAPPGAGRVAFGGQLLPGEAHDLAPN